MKRTMTSRTKAEMFRAALSCAGGRPEELIRKLQDLAKEKRRLQVFEIRLNEKNRNMEECIIKEKNHVQERIMAMAAWEDQLDQITRELDIIICQH